MTRILVICNDSDYFLRHRTPTVDRLVADGHEVTVITGGYPIPSETCRGWAYVNTPIERFAFHPLRDFALLRQTLRYLRAERPAALHLITLKPAVFSGLAAILARRFGRGPQRVVITIPGLGRLMSPASRQGGWPASLMRTAVGWAIRSIGRQEGVHFTFETAEDRHHWLKGGLVREENSSVISGAGVDPQKFFPCQDRSRGGPVRILFASRLLRSKGLDAFLELARVFKGDPRVRFVVAGMVEPHDPDGYSTDALRSEAAIDFLGEIRDMPALLREIDLVCLPTRYGEGIPRILIEAAASGVACLATDLGGCREIVKDGETGTLVPPAETPELARTLIEAVRAYLDQPEILEQHGRAGHALFSKGDFTEAAVVERFVSLLDPARN